METPLYFRNNSHKLYGVLHSPDNEHVMPLKHQLGIIFCHPFAEEKLIAQRVFVTLARKLTRAGMYCLRFDCMGHGDSSGNFEHSSVETQLSDILCAAGFLREQTGLSKIGLIGLRFGATLAALSSQRDMVVDFLVLIAPIMDGRLYIDQCLRSNLTTQMAAYGSVTKDRKQLIDDLMAGNFVNIDGYLINRDLYMQMAAINLLKDLPPHARHILLVQVSQKVNMPFEKGIQELHAKYKTPHSDVELTNVKEDHFWKDGKIYSPQKRTLQDAIICWLQSRFA